MHLRHTKKVWAKRTSLQRPSTFWCVPSVLLFRCCCHLFERLVGMLQKYFTRKGRYGTPHTARFPLIPLNYAMKIGLFYSTPVLLHCALTLIRGGVWDSFLRAKWPTEKGWATVRFDRPEAHNIRGARKVKHCWLGWSEVEWKKLSIFFWCSFVLQVAADWDSVAELRYAFQKSIIVKSKTLNELLCDDN